MSFRREGRPEMVVSGVDGRLASRPRRLDLSAGADDPTWGRWEASGTIDPSFQEGSVRLEGDRFAADRAKLERIPFIPEEVWTHFVPRGPVDVLVRLDWTPGKDQPTFTTRTEVTLREVDASFPTLGFDATGTSGRLEVVDGVVHVDKVEGRAIGGKVAARGTLDFVATPPRIDLYLDLARINVADAPRSWQLVRGGGDRSADRQGPAARGPQPQGRRPVGLVGRGGRRGRDDPGDPGQVADAGHARRGERPAILSGPARGRCGASSDGSSLARRSSTREDGRCGSGSPGPPGT